MKVELLAPAGSKEAAIAAINSGADAIYLGGYAFGARANAINFTNLEIEEIVIIAHSLDVKVYVTVNTLIKDEEMEEALIFIDFLYKIHVDALILQDLGLAVQILQNYPDFPLHGSTQMNVHSVLQAKILAEIGFSRVILARETPLSTIINIKKQVDIELEVFVHGALCICYSGNCFFSSVVGKRSGNRGKCAQPCRLPYQINEENEKKYLLSTKDLMTLMDLEKLSAIGITSFKIEGRMKRAEYVALVTKVYHQALEAIAKNENYDYRDDIQKMKLMFNREFTKGFLLEESNDLITNINSSNHIGIRIGEVIKSSTKFCQIKLEEQLQYQDSIRFLAKKEDAIIINEIYVGQSLVKHALPNDIVKVKTHHYIEPRTIVLKTTSISLLDEIKKYPAKKINICGLLSVKENKLCLQVNYEQLTVTVYSRSSIKKSTSDDYKNRLISQIMKTNNTIYRFTEIINNVENVFIPISDINEMRREVLEKLTKIRLMDKNIRKPQDKIKKTELTEKEEKTNQNFFDLLVFVTTKEQLKAAIDCGIKNIFVENPVLSTYFVNDKINYIYMKPRINEDDKNRNIGNFPVAISQYSNVFNAETVAFYVHQGYDYIGLSIELNKDDIKKLILAYQKKYNFLPQLFIMAYGHYELMIMKHCLISKIHKCQKLSCGLCLEKKYFLKDRYGYYFPLLKDDHCRLRLLNSQKLHLISYIDEIKALNCSPLLVFTIEDYHQTVKVIHGYQAKLRHESLTLDIDDSTTGLFNSGVL